MGCLTEEELARAALALVDDAQWKSHAEHCDICREKLASIRQLTNQLSAAHGKLDRAHAATRTRLLDSLSAITVPAGSTSIWEKLTSKFFRLTIGQRIAAGGLSATSVVGLLLLVVIIAQSATRISAMERMLKAVREVKSYSFRLSEKTTWPAKDNEPPKVREMDDFTCWRAPEGSEKQWLGDLCAEMKAWRIQGTDARDVRTGEPGFHIKEVYRTGEPGIVIVYSHRLGGGYYFRTPPSLADNVPSNSPIAKLLAIHDQSGEVLRELGTREIGGKQARGYIASFKDAAPFRGCSEVEVWVDAGTDLPLEFSWKQEQEGIVDELRITDCRWNIALDPQLFVTTPPEGLIDATPPSRDEDIAQITAALKLYARLSGGHYPQVTEFDDVAIRDEMLRLAGFTGAPQENWNEDPIYREIQRAQVGLNWIARVLRKKPDSAYYGTTIGPQDPDKVLLWCLADAPDQFRVFYGDLRTEIMPVAKWSQLVPPEAAAAHQPE